MFPHGINGGLQKRHGGDTGNFDRILEREEQPGTRPLIRIHLQQVSAIEQHLTGGHVVALPAGQNVRQRAFAGSVRPHDRMHLAGLYRETYPVQDFLAVHGRVQILNFDQ